MYLATRAYNSCCPSPNYDADVLRYKALIYGLTSYYHTDPCKCPVCSCITGLKTSLYDCDTLSRVQAIHDHSYVNIHVCTAQPVGSQ